MADLPPPSLPPSHPTYRHLGTAVEDRSVRIQMWIALLAGLVMIAVPLYLWRRPRAEAATENEGRNAVKAVSSASSQTALDHPLPSASTAVEPKIPGMVYGVPKILKCGTGRMKVLAEQCDRQSYFEDLLLRTVRENSQCFAEKGASGSVNLVLDINHKSKKLHTWAGKSGTMKLPARRKIASCIGRAFAPPEWAQVIHQYSKYQISLLVTLPEPDTKSLKP